MSAAGRTSPPRCPKCDSAMAEGFLSDHTSHSIRKVTEWIEGSPERSLLFGVKTRGRERRSIVCFRCTRCGFLEQYAPGG